MLPQLARFFRMLGRREDIPAPEHAKADPAGGDKSLPIIRLVNRIIEDAHSAKTSHIHIQPEKNGVIVRFRIDGTCHSRLMLPTKVGPALVARLKFMGNLDLAEHRLPQEGRIRFQQYSASKLDLNVLVLTAPLLHGEGVVLQLTATEEIRKENGRRAQASPARLPRWGEKK
jgi:type IV pilus assembly protein PilB